jgi:hypothetical protein
MKISNESLYELVGTVVDDVKIGVGTFINIFSHRPRNNTKYNFWIYLSQWALTKDGQELLSSDQSCNLSDFDFKSIFVEGISYREIVILDHEELKLIFSHGVRLEIWGDADVYGESAEMAYLYRDDQLLNEIRLS